MMREFVLLAIPALVSACGSSGSGSPAPACGVASTGVVQVNVDSLPDGADANVLLTNGSITHAVTGRGLLQLDSGEYAVDVSTVTTPDPIVRAAYRGTVTSPTLKVCDGLVASLNINYDLIPASHRLWWGNENAASNTLAYDAEELRESGDQPASFTAQTAGALPGAFDRAGNLWVVDGTSNATGLKRYSVNVFGADGPKVPEIVLTSNELSGGSPGPTSLAFDPSGNLWVSVLYEQTVVEFDASHLSVSGEVTPDIVISNVPSPNALAFDTAHNLWVGSGDNVIAYDAARLSASIADPPDISLSGMTPKPVVGALTNVQGLAFTYSQDLWVNWNGTLAVVKKSELKSGVLTPSIQITTDTMSLPQGLAIDEGGGLWFAYSVGTFAKLGKDQLTASGVVAPEVIISSRDLGSATSPAFFPAPASLPLYSSLP